MSLLCGSRLEPLPRLCCLVSWRWPAVMKLGWQGVCGEDLTCIQETRKGRSQAARESECQPSGGVRLDSSVQQPHAGWRVGVWPCVLHRLVLESESRGSNAHSDFVELMSETVSSKCKGLLQWPWIPRYSKGGEFQGIFLCTTPHLPPLSHCHYPNPLGLGDSSCSCDSQSEYTAVTWQGGPGLSSWLLERLRKEDQEFKAWLVNLERPCLNTS